MNRRHLLASAAAVTSALLLGLGAPPAGAQGRPGGGGGQGGPGMMMGGRGGQNNPAQSAVMQLIRRDDVRSELLLTAQQREQLAALDTDSQTEMRQKMQEFRQQQNFNPQDFQNLSQEERQAKMQEMQKQMQGVMSNYQTDLDKRIEKILNGKATGGVAQMARLKQLDLQWRTPLSLVDKKVAESLPVTLEQQPKIQAVYQEYQTASQQAMQKAFAGMQNLTAADGSPLSQQDRMKEMQRRMAATQPEMDKAKKTAADKVVAMLTAEQKQKWADMLGRKFTFRTAE